MCEFFFQIIERSPIKCLCVGCILLLNWIQIAKKLMKQVNDNGVELIMWIKLFGYYRNK